MAFLERVLTALASQRCDLPWDFWAVDSGSTDGTWECLQSWHGRLGVEVHLRQIHPTQFNHGDTRNLLMALSGGDLCVFLTQDAIPSGPDWLATLAANFTGSAPVGAAYCRNVPRADAPALTRLLCATDPGYARDGKLTLLPDKETYAALDPDSRRLLYNFNDVASALPRELWELHPFPRTVFGEDVLQARAILEAGYAIAYDAVATVEHSHDYNTREIFERARIDGRFNAQWLDRICLASEQDVDVLCERLRPGDEADIEELGLEPAARADLEASMAASRRAAFSGLEQGGRDRTRFPSTVFNATRELSILFVVHGFPPDTWAGTEIYTLNLALELQRRGHRVSLFVRGPGQNPEEPELSVHEESVEGLRVLRLVHRLEHRRLSESFSKPAVERVFERVLDTEQPDLVHFQHLIHTSVGLVDVARAAGKATVVTCHDYWALCARVQLIRTDGKRCEGNMGAGCLPCVKGHSPSVIPLARRLGQIAPGPLRGLARSLSHTSWVPDAWQRIAGEYLDMREREQRVPAAYAACDLLISPSRYLREVYLESGHFDPERLIFSENGLRSDHVQALQKTPDPEGRLRFGFVGSLVWYKGVEVLVRAMQRLTTEDCVLHIYGDFQPESDEHHAALVRAADGARVEFHGRFDNSRLSAVHAQIDVLVVPSLWAENAPVTIQEAFLTGTPLLVSDIGGMAEYVPDGQNGLQFRAGDDEDLASKMRRLLSEPDLLKELSRSFPPVKTVAENAAEMEFRYRALCCRVREAHSTAREFRAGDCARRGGPVDSQGEDLLLLRPGGAFVEYDLGYLKPGTLQLHLTLLALGSEGDLQQGGHLTLDGVEIGMIPAFCAHGQDQQPTLSFEAQLQAGGGRLRIESALEPGQPEAHLRIVRLVVDRAPSVVDTQGAS
jgi:glycosyltransferase involved in cell wall biosynthesis